MGGMQLKISHANVVWSNEKLLDWQIFQYKMIEYKFPSLKITPLPEENFKMQTSGEWNILSKPPVYISSVLALSFILPLLS